MLFRRFFFRFFLDNLAFLYGLAGDLFQLVALVAHLGHLGGVADQDHAFALVDVCDVRKRRFWRGRDKMHSVFGEFSDRLNRQELCDLLVECQVASPEDAPALWRTLLQARGRLIARQRNKRRKQLFAGYAKFVREENGISYALDAARDPLVAPEELERCIRMETTPEDAARLWEEDLHLTLLRIPHRRIAAWQKPGTLWLMPVSGSVSPEEKAELQERLTLAGLPPENWDFVRDAWDRPQIAWRM